MLNSTNTANGIAKPQPLRAVRIVAMIVTSETNGAPKTNRVITGTGGPIRGQFTIKRTRCSDRPVISWCGRWRRSVGFAHPAVRGRVQHRLHLGAELELGPGTGYGKVFVSRLVHENAHRGGTETRGAILDDLQCFRPYRIRYRTVQYDAVIHLNRTG